MVKFKFLKCTILFILFFGLSLNAQKINWDNTPLNPTTIYYSKNHFNLNRGIALKGFDPVSFFTKDAATQANGTISYTYNGVKYFFANSR